MISSNTCCILAAHSWRKSPVSPHPKGAVLHWDLVTVEAIQIQQTHCYVQVTGFRLFKFCHMVCYSAGSLRWVHCHKEMEMVINSTQKAVAFKWCSAKSATASPKLLHHHQPEQIHGRMNTCFHIVYVQIWCYFFWVHLYTVYLIKWQQKTHQIRQHFSFYLPFFYYCPILSSSCEL